MANPEIYDVTIIGGGPAGLYSAFYSGLRELKTKIVEYQPVLGGKVNVYPEKMIWDVGGQPPVRGEKFVEQVIEQGLTFEPTVVLDEKIISMDKNEDGLFVLTAASGRVHYSKTIISAVGGGILNPQRLPLEGAERFEVTNLNYTVKSLQRFKDKNVIISGGGDAAIDWANELVNIAKNVYLTYRRDVLTGHEAQATRLLNSTAVCYANCSITKLISPKSDFIEQVELTNHLTQEVVSLPIDEVIINHGYESDASLLENSSLDIEIVDGYFMKGTPTSETAVPGLYAAGDILSHEGKLNLIAGAFQDAANAVNHAKKFIEPAADKIGMVSSHNEIFKEKNKELKKQLI